jgi:hypothetical protein
MNSVAMIVANGAGTEEVVMSYEPPFGGNWMAENAWLTQSRIKPPPPSIEHAVWFIYAGAVIQALSAILEIAAVRGRIQSVLATRSATPLTASQLNAAQAIGEVILVLGGAVGVSLWFWMARKNKAGRRWARSLSTVFFVILTVGLVAVVAQPVAGENKIIPVAEWVAGFVAMVLLWQTESSDFYAARSRRY